MSKIKRELEDRAELAMTGRFVPVENEEEVRFMTSYITVALNKEHYSDLDIYEEFLHRYNNKNKVTHVGTCRVLGMPCIVYCIDPQDGETPKPFEEDYGSGYPCSFSFVFNLDYESCSEFGDCFFEKREDGYYHRVS